MDIGNLTLFSAMKQKMQWQQARQSLLAENVANAETPGYRGRDLKKFTFSEQVNQFSTAQITTKITNSKHLQISIGTNNGFGAQQMKNYEVTPEGNGVTLEDEMMKVTTNQMEFQAVTSLYTRSMKLMRTALGR